MIYLKWSLLALIDILLLVTLPVAAPLISLFTKEGPYGLPEYTWGWIWGTFDNPPQGDQGWVTKRCIFPGITTGVKGYINRVGWMFRNPLYGYARKAAVPFTEGTVVIYKGNPDISDKYKISGSYFAKAVDKDDKVVAFEYYLVKPIGSSNDLRVRLGWKIMSSKFNSRGFAPIVNNINPFDGYGNE